MKFTSPSKLIRRLRIIFIVSAFVTRATVAQASQTCTWIDNFTVSSGPPIQEQIHAHAKAIPGLESYQIRQINSRFFIVSSGEEKCREASTCLYRLLDVRNGAVRDVFAFQGTGRVLLILSPLAFWWEPLQDEYSYMAFETIDNTYLEVKLPRFGNTVLVVPQSAEDIRMLQRICGANKK